MRGNKIKGTYFLFTQKNGKSRCCCCSLSPPARPAAAICPRFVCGVVENGKEQEQDENRDSDQDHEFDRLPQLDPLSRRRGGISNGRDKNKNPVSRITITSCCDQKIKS